MERQNKVPNWTKHKAGFYQRYQEMDDGEILRELLYVQTRILNKVERNRQNTSSLVWWFIALPLIFGIILFFLGT